MKEIIPIYVKIYGEEKQIGSLKIRYNGTDKSGWVELVKAKILMKKGDLIYGQTFEDEND